MLVDYVRPISASALNAAGVTGVLRYWPKQGGSTVVVGLSAGEIADLSAGHVAFGTIYEAPSASWMGGGYAAGVQAAQWLQTQFAATGHTPRTVYFAADSNTLSTTAVNACLDGAASILGRPMVGLYGFLPQLQAAQAGGHASRYWLCGHFAPASWMDLYQCNGSQPSGPTTVTVAAQVCDVDIALQTDWGQTQGDMMSDFDTIHPVTMVGSSQPWHITYGDELDNMFGMVFGGSVTDPWTGPSMVQQLHNITTQLAAIQGALSSEEAALLAAVKAIPAAQVDPKAVAAALDALGLPAQLVAAFVAVLNKAASTS